MPIKKIKICDTCGKQEDFYPKNKWGKTKKWFMVNISHVYCTKACYKRDGYNTKERDGWECKCGNSGEYRDPTTKGLTKIELCCMCDPMIHKPKKEVSWDNSMRHLKPKKEV